MSLFYSGVSFCTDRCTCGTEKQPGSSGSKLSEKLKIAMEEYLPIFHSLMQHLTQQYYCDNYHISVCLVYNQLGKYMMERMVDMLEGARQGYKGRTGREGKKGGCRRIGREHRGR